MNIRDSYETRMPTKQNIFDRFKGNFATKFPGVDTGGYANLSDDDRLHWCNSVLNLNGKNINYSLLTILFAITTPFRIQIYTSNYNHLAIRLR